MATRPNHNQVGRLLGGNLRDRSGGTTDRTSHIRIVVSIPCFENSSACWRTAAWISASSGVDVAAAPGCDSLVDVDDQESGAVAPRRLSGHRYRSPRLLGSIQCE